MVWEGEGGSGSASVGDGRWVGFGEVIGKVVGAFAPVHYTHPAPLDF